MLWRDPSLYSRAEHVSDGIVHVSGLAFALVGGPLLVWIAAARTDDMAVVSAMLVYAVCLTGMLAASAVYNMHRERWSDRLRRIDQSAIYLKIAGTYTPFVALSGSGAFWFLAFLWTVAVTGVSLIVLGRRRRVLSVALYLALGWAGVLWSAPLIANLTAPASLLLLVGGSLYTVGVVFHVAQRLPFHNTIWHLFVLTATAFCYAALVVELVHRAPQV